MDLLLFHRVLIVSAIGLGVLLFVLGLFDFFAHGSVAWLAGGVAGGCAGVALGFYLRWFLRKRITPSD